MANRYVNTASTAGGDGTTNNTTGATRAYVTLGDGISAEAADLVSAADGITFICTGGEDEVGYAGVVTGYTTDEDYYVTIQAAGGDEAGTEWDTDKYHVVSSTEGNATTIDLQDAFGRVYNLQVGADVANINGTARTGVCIGGGLDADQEAANYHVVGCYARIYGVSGSWNPTNPWNGIFFNPNDASTTVAPLLHIYNNIIHLDSAETFTGGARGFWSEHRAHTAYVYNNTLIGPWTIGIAGLAIGNSRLVYTKNNIIEGATTAIDDYASGTDDPGADGYSDYNATDNANFGANYTTQSNDRVSQTFTFASATDFALTNTDAGAREHGLTNPSSGIFTDDINGTSRPIGTNWDMGAHEAPAAGGTINERTLTDSMSVADSNDSYRDLVKLVSDNLLATDSISVETVTQAIVRILTDSLSLTDSVGVAREKAILLVNNLVVTDLAEHQLWKFVVLNDSIEIFDNLIAQLQGRIVTALLQDSIAVTDTSFVTREFVKQLLSSIVVTDSVVHQSVLFKLLSDNVSVTDDMIAQLIRQLYEVTLRDNLDVTDSISATLVQILLQWGIIKVGLSDEPILTALKDEPINTGIEQ